MVVVTLALTSLFCTACIIAAQDSEHIHGDLWKYLKAHGFSVIALSDSSGKTEIKAVSEVPLWLQKVVDGGTQQAVKSTYCQTSSSPCRATTSYMAVKRASHESAADLSATAGHKQRKANTCPGQVAAALPNSCTRSWSLTAKSKHSLESLEISGRALNPTWCPKSPLVSRTKGYIQVV